MGNELILSEQQNNSLAVMPVMNIEAALDRRNQMVAFVKKIMIEGTDYGKIPGTDKPCLYKPGAEKLTTFFGLVIRFQIIEKVEDWSGAEHGGEPFFYYLYRCSLWRGDALVAEGDGSCNSFESKYRWRWVGEDEIPAHLDKTMLRRRGSKVTEFEFAINKAETGGKYGKPAEYWQRFKDAIESGDARQTTRKSNSGKEFPAWEIDTTVYRIPNDDIASQVNTVLKMSQKRSFVAVTLLGVNASEFFGQDLEDYVDDSPVIEVKAEVIEPEQPKVQAATPKPANGQTNGGNGKPAPQPDKPKPYRFPSTRAETFYKEAQAATDNWYTGPEQLVQVLGGWFNFGLQDLWDEKMDYAISYPRQSQPEPEPGEVVITG